MAQFVSALLQELDRSARPATKGPDVAVLLEYSKGIDRGDLQLCARQCISRAHLRPRFGSPRLDEITRRDVEQMKASLLRKGRSATRINNVLSCALQGRRHAQRQGRRLARRDHDADLFLGGGLAPGLPPYLPHRGFGRLLLPRIGHF